MQHVVAVAEGEAAQQLIHEGLDDVEGDFAVERVEVLLEVLVAVLEDERELLVGVEDVVEADNVFVLQLLEEANLAQGRGGNALVVFI